MIRHETQSGYLLFTQHDHALLSGRIAERVGNDRIRAASAQTIQGIALHDCGWPIHDDHPTIDRGRRPVHVFDTPPLIATEVWSASARRASGKDPYSGLLVSLHVLNLSLMSQEAHREPADLFELNKFQHAQIELQERLRPRVGLRIDRPLTHGLAEPGTSDAEDALLADFRLLRAMDTLSLALLCGEKLRVTTPVLGPLSDGGETRLNMTRIAPFAVHVSPWIFDEPELRFEVPAKRIPAKRYESDAELQEEYGKAPVEVIGIRVMAGRDSAESRLPIAE